MPKITPNLHLTNTQRSIIIGSMLGDGSLDKVNTSRSNSRYTETHGIQQFNWLYWKQLAINPITSSLKKGKSVARLNLGNGKIISDPSRKYEKCTLRTTTLPEFTKLEKKWYKRDDKGGYVFKQNGDTFRRIKIIPHDLQLDALALAVWYIDDGTNMPKKRAANIYTLSFTENEVDVLVEHIKRLGIACKKTEYCQTKSFYVAIGAESYEFFIKMVTAAIPNLPDDLKYKVDLTDYKISWKKSSDYHPRSKFNDEIVEQIMAKAKAKIPQRTIAKKYDIHYKSINRLLKGKTLYESELFDEVNYRSTTGVAGVSWTADRQSYLAQIAIPKEDGKYHHLCLGYYSDKNVATIVATKAREMRDNGVTDLNEYKQMKSEYKPKTRRNNKSGINGVSFHNTNKKWSASISFDGKTIQLGAYGTKGQAAEIRHKAEVMLTNGIKELKAYEELKNAYKSKLKNAPC